MKKKRVVVIAVVILALISLVSVWIAGGLLAASANQPIGSQPSDLPAESVQFSSESGSTIHGWLIPGQKHGGAILLRKLADRCGLTAELDAALTQ